MKRQGFVKIKKIDDLVQWVKYCSKDEEIMKEILNVDLPLTRDSKIFKREKHKKCRARIPEHKEVKFEGNIIQECMNLADSSSDESASSDGPASGGAVTGPPPIWDADLLVHPRDHA